VHIEARYASPSNQIAVILLNIRLLAFGLVLNVVSLLNGMIILLSI
jgi:hypothetical protein